MLGNVLAVWIKTLDLVELTQSSMNVSIPPASANACEGLNGGKSELARFLRAQTCHARRIEGPIGQTVWQSE